MQVHENTEAPLVGSKRRSKTSFAQHCGTARQITLENQWQASEVLFPCRLLLLSVGTENCGAARRY